jgi:uncharacterized protein DUF5667
VANALFERRRADRFAQLLDETPSGRRRHARTAGDDELLNLVGIGRQLVTLHNSTEAMAPSEEFRVGLRAMLIATAEREGIGITAVHKAPTTLISVVKAPRARFSLRRHARAAILAGLAVGTLTLSGISSASDNAVPGDALYGIKRSTEQAQLALAGSDVNRGQLYLAFAKARLAEARAVSKDHRDLLSVLNDMDSETRLGVRLLDSAGVDSHDAAPLEAINAFLASQHDGVANLVTTVPLTSRSRAAISLALLDRATIRVASLLDLVHCSSGGVSGSDDLGPMPATCLAQAARTGNGVGVQKDKNKAKSDTGKVSDAGTSTQPVTVATMQARVKAARKSPTVKTMVDSSNEAIAQPSEDASAPKPHHRKGEGLLHALMGVVVNLLAS